MMQSQRTDCAERKYTFAEAARLQRRAYRLRIALSEQRCEALNRNEGEAQDVLSVALAMDGKKCDFTCRKPRGFGCGSEAALRVASAHW